MSVQNKRSAGVRAESLLGVMIRRSTPWAAAAGVVCLITYSVIDGWSGALASLVGVGFVAFFFGVDLLVLRLTRGAPGGVTAAALMGEYLIKVLVMAGVLWLLSESTSLDLQVTAVTVVVTTVIWAVAVTAVALRTRSFFFDFPSATNTESRSDQ